jgi:hypothetical protein
MTKPLLRHLQTLLTVLGLWLAAGAPLAAQAAAGSIEGRVTNPATGTIVERARITVEGSTLETFSDADGYYRLRMSRPAPRNCACSFTGFPPAPPRR